MSLISEFREFALKGNAVDLAVGVIIGAAFSRIVDSIVGDLIMPLIGVVLGDPFSKRNPAELTPEYARNVPRSIKPEYLVCVGICSHLGCSPVDRFTPGAQPSLPDNWQGGFLCPCHGSTFDLAGRVFKNKPAPTNLEVPPHMYLSDTKLLIGEGKKA